MARIRLVIDTTKSKKLANDEYAVMLRISQNRQQLRTSTGVRVKKEFWDDDNQCVIAPKAKEKGDPESYVKNVKLDKLTADCNKKMILNEDEVASMDVHQLKAFLFEKKVKQDTNLFKWMQELIDLKKENKQKSRAEGLASVRNKILVYCKMEKHPNPMLNMNSIDEDWLLEFERWCATTPMRCRTKETMKVNAIANYMVNIRQTFFHAIKRKAISTTPFYDYKIKEEEVDIRNLSFNDLRKIRDEVVDNVSVREERARDMYLLSIYMKGICPIDLFNLTNDNVHGDRIRWKRHKTGEKVSVKLEPEIIQLIEKYRGNTYLLCFADANMNRKQARKGNLKYRYADSGSWGFAINEGLSSIQKSLGIVPWMKLTFYTTRHTVGSLIVSKQVGARTEDSSQALGHKRKGFETTLKYTQFDDERGDDVNRIFLDVLAKPVDSEGKIITLSLKPIEESKPVDTTQPIEVAL